MSAYRQRQQSRIAPRISANKKPGIAPGILFFAAERLRDASVAVRNTPLHEVLNDEFVCQL